MSKAIRRLAVLAALATLASACYGRARSRVAELARTTLGCPDVDVVAITAPADAERSSSVEGTYEARGCGQHRAYTCYEGGLVRWSHSGAGGRSSGVDRGIECSPHRVGPPETKVRELFSMRFGCPVTSVAATKMHLGWDAWPVQLRSSHPDWFQSAFTVAGCGTSAVYACVDHGIERIDHVDPACAQVEAPDAGR